MPTEPVTLTTRDGQCRAFRCKPQGQGPWPAVIVYMDALAIRPALLDLGQRIADFGYAVLVPDLFYRSAPYATIDAREAFTDPAVFKEIKAKHMVHVTLANVLSDTTALLDYLDQQPDVKAGGIGTTGYCMGGRFALAAAGRWPERVRAAACFHGGNVITNDPDSPDRLAPHMRARILVAGAMADASFPDSMKQQLATAFAGAGVAHSVETWPAKHGWVFSDTPVYDRACSERHFERLRQLFAETLVA